MRKILAAIDGSPISRDVLDATLYAADMLALQPEAVHVGDCAAAARAARASGVPVRMIGGEAPQALRAAAAADDVDLLVIGARGGNGMRRPAGSVTEALMTSLPRPLLVLPRRGFARQRLRRVMVALDGAPTTAAALAPWMTTALDRGLDLVIVHVLDPATAPPFVDQPHHWSEAFGREFRARHAPSMTSRIELRAGDPPGRLLDAATELHAGLVALAWHQVLDPGHAAVVRYVIDAGDLPVLLVPVEGVTAAVSPEADQRAPA